MLSRALVSAVKRYQKIESGAVGGGMAAKHARKIGEISRKIESSISARSHEHVNRAVARYEAKPTAANERMMKSAVERGQRMKAAETNRKFTGAPLKSKALQQKQMNAQADARIRTRAAAARQRVAEKRSHIKGRPKRFIKGLAESVGVGAAAGAAGFVAFANSDAGKKMVSRHIDGRAKQRGISALAARSRGESASASLAGGWTPAKRAEAARKAAATRQRNGH
jgi:hypothetical protein